MSKSTELEALCRWLNAGNSSRAKSDLYFTQYYQCVRTYLLRFINRELGNAKDLAAEDIFQEIMQKMHEMMKETRPAAATSVKASCAALSTGGLGPFFKKRSDAWQVKTDDWADRAMSFPMDYALFKSPVLDEKAQAFNAEMEPLKNEAKSLTSTCEQESNGQAFIAQVTDIAGLLSILRIPLDDLLYVMARNKVRDRGRKKSNQLEVAFGTSSDEEDDIDYGLLAVNEHSYQLWQQGAQDQLAEIEIEQTIAYLLQAPLRAAQQKFDHAQGRQDKLAKQEQLEKAYAHYITLNKILEKMREEYTQEEIADDLGLTRDQVRSRQAQIKDLISAKPIKNSTNSKPLSQGGQP